jgi:hypothetical protein
MIGVQWMKHSSRVNFGANDLSPYNAGKYGGMNPDAIYAITKSRYIWKKFYKFFKEPIFYTTFNYNKSSDQRNRQPTIFIQQVKHEFYYNIMKQLTIRLETLDAPTSLNKQLFNQEASNLCKKSQVTTIFGEFSGPSTTLSTFQYFIISIFWKFIKAKFPFIYF